jgi:hypothetical protein
MVFVLALGCKKEKPTVPNGVDPCDESNFTTNFTIGYRLGASAQLAKKYHINDYAFSGSMLKFEVENDCFDEYEFLIGSDTYNQDCVLVYFDEYDTVKNLPIRLITKKHNVLCENYAGSDTVYRYLTTVFKCDWPIAGTYRGVTNINPLDSFDLTIYRSLANPASCEQWWIMNYHNSGCDAPWNISNYSYTQGKFPGMPSICNAMGNGRFVFNPVTQDLQLFYVQSNIGFSSDTIHYRGYKLNP